MNISERDVKLLAEGRYNRRYHKAWGWIAIASLLFCAAYITVASNIDMDITRVYEYNGQRIEIKSELYQKNYFYIDGEWQPLDEIEPIKNYGNINPTTIFLAVALLGYLSFFVYLRRQQNFVNEMVTDFKANGSVSDRFVDYTPIKKEKKKK